MTLSEADLRQRLGQLIEKANHRLHGEQARRGRGCLQRGAGDRPAAAARDPQPRHASLPEEAASGRVHSLHDRRRPDARQRGLPGLLRQRPGPDQAIRRGASRPARKARTRGQIGKADQARGRGEGQRRQAAARAQSGRRAGFGIPDAAEEIPEAGLPPDDRSDAKAAGRPAGGAPGLAHPRTRAHGTGQPLRGERLLSTDAGLRSQERGAYRRAGSRARARRAEPRARSRR